MSSSSLKARLAIAAGVGVAVGVAVYLRRRSLRLADAVETVDTEIAVTVTPEKPSAAVPTVVGVAAEKAVPEASPMAEVSEEDSAAAASEVAAAQEAAKKAKERGNKRFQGKQFEKAIEEYTEAIRLAPDKTDKDVAVFYGNRAQCYASLERHEQAEADCDESLKVAPDYVKALCRRALAREKQNKAEAAFLDFTAAALLSAFTNEVGVKGADRVLKLIAKDKAEQRLSEPMRHLPSSSFIATFIDSFQSHRSILALGRRPLPTISAELAALQLPADSVAHALARASCLCEAALVRMTSGAFEEAFLDWLAVCALLPPPPTLCLSLPRPDGCVDLGIETQQQVLSQWKEGSGEVMPCVPPAYALAMSGMFLHLRGNYEEAMACYDYALSLEPGQITVLLKRASLWFEKEDLPKALADFDLAIEHQPECADIYCHRGQLHILQNDAGAALIDLRKAVQLDGDSVLARIQLGMALHRQGQTSEARRIFEEAELKFPNSPDVLNYYGELLVEGNELDDARRKFEKALSISDKRFALAHVNLGVLQLHASSDVEGAIGHCGTAIEVDPLCETAHVHMAHLLLQKIDLEGAVASYDKAVALLRMKQELVDCFSMREATAAQLQLLHEQPLIYGPAMEQHRAKFAEIAASAGGQ